MKGCASVDQACLPALWVVAVDLCPSFHTHCLLCAHVQFGDGVFYGVEHGVGGEASMSILVDISSKGTPDELIASLDCEDACCRPVALAAPLEGADLQSHVVALGALQATLVDNSVGVPYGALGGALCSCVLV